VGTRVGLTLFSVVALMVIFGMNQDAYAMTILWGDDPPSGSSPVCSIDNDLFCADDFVLSSSATVQDAHFWIFEPGTLADNVHNWQILSDGGGIPVSPPIAAGTGVLNMQPMLDLGVCPTVCFEVWIDIVPGVPLGPGTYWLALSDKPEYHLIVDSEPNDPTQVIAFEFAAIPGDWELIPNFDLPFIVTGKFAAVGGDMIQIQTISVLAAGAQYTMAWMIPVIVSGIGIAIVIARKF